MFCPNCGNPDQQSDTYCRNCGEYLLDPAGNSYLLNKVLGGTTPATQINVNLGISLLTIFACFFLIGFLKGNYDALFTRTGELPPAVIYWVYGFLALISAWQMLSVVVGSRLRNKLGKKGSKESVNLAGPGFHTRETMEQLRSPNMPDGVPISITEEPTKILDPVHSTRPRN